MGKFTKYLTQLQRRWHLRLPVLLFGAMLCGVGGFAQSGAGAIQGTVTDVTGAVIPGASIHVVNQNTGVTADTLSNSVGFYQVPGLFTGDYLVTVISSGMRPYKATVQLLVAQNAVINVLLTTGSVTEQVQVSADVVQLTTSDNGTITSTLENDRINQLPMNGRELISLVSMTTPGMESSGSRTNGLMPGATDYVADGVVMTSRQFGAAANQAASILPDPDAVQEVQVQTVNTSAQYDAPAMALLTTKSGTNNLHGSMFETMRNNSVLGNARQRSVSYVLPQLVRNEFGASAGAPIIVPWLYHGQDKSFWFFAYERYSLAQSTPGNVTVPTVAMRNGDFSNLYNSAGQLQTLYDPNTTAATSNCNGTGTANSWCRTAFTNNKIPTSRQSPTDKVLNDILPLPGSDANPLVTSNLSLPNFTYMVVLTETFRLDHAFSQGNRAYLRFTNDEQTDQYAQSSSQVVTIAADGVAAGAVGVINLPNQTIGTALGYTHVFSPTFFAETIASIEWGKMRFLEAGSTADSPNYESMLGLPNNFGTKGMPNISGGVTNYATGQGAWGLTNIIASLDENFTKTVGHHQLQFGGRYRHERLFQYNHSSNDSISFNGYATGLELLSSGANYTPTSNTGNADGDLYLGAASNYSVIIQQPNIHAHMRSLSAYIQDNYHVSRRLTANLGLRWDAMYAPWVKSGIMTSFDLKNDAQVYTQPLSTLISEGYTTQGIVNNLTNLGVKYESAQEAGMPAKLLKDYPLQFLPRIGLAYQIFGTQKSTILRGAYGRYLYYTPTRNTFYNNIVSNPPFNPSYYESYTSSNQSPDGLPNYLLRSAQSVVMGTNSSNVVDSTSSSALLPGLNPWVVAPNYSPETVTETNLTVEQPLKGNSAMRLSWVWTHGSNLQTIYYPNYHPSTYVWEMQTGTVSPTGTYSSTATGPYDQRIYGSSFGYAQNSGWSNDNALEVNYQRLYHRGIAYQISYVWSRPFRLGGNGGRDSLIYPAQNYQGTSGTVGTMTSPYGTVITPYLPPSRPAGVATYADWHQLKTWEEYRLDSAIPIHHIQFNGIVDLPFGRGKRYFGNTNRLVNELVGGFQLAGDGSIFSQNFQPTSTNWGPTNPLHIYKHKAKVNDCRSGTCYKGYEWFNGYIAPTVASGFNGTCTLSSKNVSGLPSGWTPYQSPVDTDCNPSDPAYTYYNSNEVAVALANGTQSPVAYSPGPASSNPYSKTFINGPFNWTIDLSLFKVFPITEKINLRVNMDAFNALNMQGHNNPDATTGIESLTSSYNTPRQIQLTARFTF